MGKEIMRGIVRKFYTTRQPELDKRDDYLRCGYNLIDFNKRSGFLIGRNLRIHGLMLFHSTYADGKSVRGWSQWCRLDGDIRRLK